MVRGAEVLYTANAEVVCPGCSVETRVEPARGPGMGAVIAGGIAAVVPMFVTMSSSSSVSVDGRVVSGTYRDYVAIGCGVVAVVCGVVGVVAGRRAIDRRAMGLAVLVIVAGGYQLARGFGVFDDRAGDDGAPAMRAMAEPPPVPVPTVAPEHTCTDGPACSALGKELREAAPARAVVAYTRACDFRSANACYNAALALGDTPDRAKLAGLYQRACELGSQLGCANAAVGYLKGDGVAADLERARTLALGACEHDVAAGCRIASTMYRDGVGVEQDTVATQRLAAKACELGSDEEVSSCADAGYYLVEGKAQNAPARARAYFTRECELAPAHCMNLGVVNERGLGGAKDLAKARALYDQACTAGNLEGCNNLGTLADEGQGGAVDKAAARALFQQACDGGVELGCKNLKRMKAARPGSTRRGR